MLLSSTVLSSLNICLAIDMSITLLFKQNSVGYAVVRN